MTAASDRVDRLARVLEEHEVWEHPGWIVRPTADGHRKQEIRNLLRVEEYPLAIIAPEIEALRSAIREVESGEVFGSRARCAICDGEPAWGYRVAGCSYFLCRCVRASGPNNGIWHKAGLADPGSRDDCIRAIIKARRLYREKKAKPPTRIFTGVDWGVDGSCCTVRLRREPDGRWTLLDEVFEPAKAKPAPNPVREWGMEWPGKAGVLGSPHEYQPDTLLRWRDRLRAGKIRAEVPKRKPAPDWVRRVSFKPHPAQAGVCYPYHVAPLFESVSGNPRGDDFLHDLWREDEKRTQALRDAEAVRRAKRKTCQDCWTGCERAGWPGGTVCDGWRETPAGPDDALVERVKRAIYVASTFAPGPPYEGLGVMAHEALDRTARAAIAEVRRGEGGR